MKDRKGKRQTRKKPTIFRIFLIPLITIMLIQSMITMGTLMVRRTAGILGDYSSGMMSRLVENRGVILQNDMNQRWAAVHEQEYLLKEVLEDFLKSQKLGLKDLLDSETMRSGLLKQLFPECLEILQNNSTTGTFLILTGNDMRAEADFSGFYIRDSDPETNPANFTDLLLERGSKYLSREWNIPLDSNWTTSFHMDGYGQNADDSFFYEPWKAGADYPDTDTENLGYWSMPFTMDKDDSYEMITYSLPLRYKHQVYGVLGVEISCAGLSDYFPAAELSDSQQSGYMLAVKESDGSYIPLTGRGLLYDLTRSYGDTFSLQETNFNNLSLVRDVTLQRKEIYAVSCPLKLYGNYVPYDHTEWVLLGLNTETELFGMGRQLYFWMSIAVLVGLIFGVIGIYILIRHLTRPVQHLMQCISKGSAGLLEFKPSNILEIDALYDVVNELTEKQKEAANILLEEKERYRVVLESAKDVFFSYDMQTHVLDIVNHKTMSGQWKCQKYEDTYINYELIYEPDREEAMKAMLSRADELYTEMRLRWPEESEYRWTALTGKVVYDTDGRRRKLVGSICDIEEQKEREAEQLRRNTIDAVTGLYVFHAGMEQIRECRRKQPDGVMIDVRMIKLQEINEQNGIVFGDLILEEIGNLLRECGQEFTGQDGREMTAMRINSDELVIWLEKQPKEQAEKFTAGLLEKIAAAFEAELFSMPVHAGLACGKKEHTAEKLVCMAQKACGAAYSAAGRPYFFYEDIPEEKRRDLPALQGRDIHTFGYGEDAGLASLALNLFGKGADFSAQMMLIIQKIGRFYQADGVLVTLLQADFTSNYLNYQWHRQGEGITDTAGKYTEDEKERFYSWLGQDEVRGFSKEDSRKRELQCFLNAAPDQQGIVLPMYDSGNYMGNICILGAAPQLLEQPEEYQNLAELSRVIQSQINQQQSDTASRAKSEFLSRMSHEIRTPMNGIIGMTAIALQEKHDPDKVMECLQKIQSSSNYLLGLINDILDMSKIESGKMKLELSDFDAHEMLDTIRELITPQAEAKNIDFIQNVELTHSWFLGDRMRISQVLINLLGNAVKFTPHKGRVILTVKESIDAKDEVSLSFAVKDTGIGIASEEHEKVFHSFEQAGGINPSKQQGTGLGLSISSRLVQMMGSSIQLDSQPGEGSTFSFTIPLKTGENKEAQKDPETFTFDGYRVLVVEDNMVNIEIATYLLEDRNFEVDCVYDGAQAVERIRTTAPGTYDVVLMDIMMPVMDGLEAARTIRGMDREDCRTLPIVAMSANAFDDDLKKSVECGMNGHLSKPVEVDKLYQTLYTVLNGSKKT